MYLISPLPHSSKSSIPSSQAPPATLPPAWYHQQHPHRAVGHTHNLNLTDGVIGFFQKKNGSVEFYPKADAGTKANFGFNVKYNKKGTNLKGRVNIVIRNGDRVYQIKSNAINQLSVDSTNATFNSKANIQDITDPYGKMTFEVEHERIALLCGGIGITPMISICRYCTDKHLNNKITLISSNKMQKDIIFKDELELMQHRNDHLKVVHTLTRPIDEWKGCRGRIFKDITQEKNELVKYTQVESFSTHSKKPYTS
jgi:hypothetical protein